MGSDFKSNLPHYIDQLTKSYHENTISEKKCLHLPDRDSVIDIIGDLEMLLYPQYFGSRSMNEMTEKYITGNLMQIVYEKLKEQLELAFLYQLDSDTPEVKKLAEEKAENACMVFFEKLPEIRKYLAMDIQAAFDGDPAAESKDQIVFSYPCITAISIHRVAHVFYELSVPILPRIMSEYAHSKTGIDIHPGARIGKYFFIDHGTGVVVGETTEIGDHVKIYQGVTLGALSTRNASKLRNTKRHPTIEDNVTIYSGASVLGGETVIGKNSTIGGSSFITASVPPDSMVSVRINELNIE